MTSFERELKALVKEAVKEVMIELGQNVIPLREAKGVGVVKATDKVIEGEEKSIGKVKEVKVAEEEEEEEEEVKVADRQTELEAMSYNDLKALVKELGGKAVGSKAKIITQILELEAQDNSSTGEAETPDNIDEEDGETGELRDFLKDLEDSEVKVIAKELQIKTKGISIKDLIEEELKDIDALNKALEILGYFEDEDENSEDEDEDEELGFDIEDIKDLLGDLTKSELKEIAKELNIKVTTKSKGKDLINEILALDLSAIIEVLTKLGYVEVEEDEDINEEEEEEEEEETTLADDLGLEEYTVEELADILEENGLPTSGKKQALIDRIVLAVKDGKIELEDEDEDEENEESEEEEDSIDVEALLNNEEMELEDIKDIAKELGLKINKKTKKALIKEILKCNEDDIIAVLDSLFEESEAEEFDEVDFSEVEAQLEEDIRKRYKTKKLKDTTINAFLKDYEMGLVGDKYSLILKDVSKMDKKEKLEAYILVQKALIDNDGEVHELSDCYERGDKHFCCGRPLTKKVDEEGVLFCESCGTELELE